MQNEIYFSFLNGAFFGNEAVTSKSRGPFLFSFMTWKDRYRKAYDDYQTVRYPNATKDHGLLSVKMPNVNSANGLTSLCVNLFNWSGHHLERTNNMGRPVDKRQTYVDIVGRTRVIGSMEWQKGSGTKGTSDCKGHYVSVNHKFPIPVHIEVKYGADRQSDAQKDYERKVTKTGALYQIVKTPEDLFRFFDYLDNL